MERNLSPRTTRGSSETAVTYRSQVWVDFWKATLTPRRMAFAERLKSEADRAGREAAYEAALKQVATELDGLSTLSGQLQQYRTTEVALRAELATAIAQEKQMSQASVEVERIASTVSLPLGLSRQTSGSFARAVVEHVRSQISDLEKQASGTSRLREALANAHTAGIAFREAEKGFTKATQQLEKAQKVLQRAGARIGSARNLSKAATTAKTRILEQVFNEKLNKLWTELFRRLVKNEQFLPRLREPQTSRGQIRTSIEGTRAGINAFEQFGAVASAGNLNTAALSLFLSLHLIEQPRHKLLVLDDPVQSMDDLHVVQLANLLREIRLQANRQLVLAVHERALFDYLCLELGPGNQQASLLTIELERQGSTHASKITVTPHKWKPDKVRFGTA